MSHFDVVIKAAKDAREERLKINPELSAAIAHDAETFKDALRRIGVEHVTQDHVNALFGAVGLVSYVSRLYEQHGQVGQWISEAIDKLGINITYIALELHDGLEVQEAFNAMTQEEEDGAND